MAEPAAQIHAQVFHFARPDARDGRRQHLRILGGHAIEHAVGEVPDVARAVFAAFDLPEQLELRGVEQRAARQRIHLLQRHRLVARAQPVNAVQQEAIGAGREMLQRGRRIGARGEPISGQHRAGGGIGIDNPVGAGPEIPPAPAARAQRTGQARIHLHQVAALAFGLARAAH